MAYNTAKNRSKNKELFGKGCLEGAAASEAGNNAVTGGAAIPMMTLGIPGSSGAAILMGGLMIHGMQPGGDLFHAKAEITYAIIFGFLLANLFMGAIGLLMARYVVLITRVPANILCPIVVVLASIGSYAISNDMFNVYTMFVFGAIGYVLRKAQFPPAAMVLGLLLGKMAERGLRQAIKLSRGDLLGYFFGRPFSIALVILILVMVVLPVVMEKRAELKKH